MLNKILCVVALLLLSLFITASRFRERPDTAKCDSVQVKIARVNDRFLLTDREALSILSNSRLNPLGKALSSINTEQMEECLNKSGFVKQSVCYKTTEGHIRIKIEQPMPAFRVFSPGGSFFISEERTVIPLSTHYNDYLPVVTGSPSKEMLKGELFDFVQYLSASSFWNAQIEQIYVTANDEVTLIPRVGEQEILLGKLTNYQTKLDNLLLFYEDGIGKVGWGKYKLINLKYDNQIVCTKK